MIDFAADNPALTVKLEVSQLKLLAKAISSALDEENKTNIFTAEEVEELRLLQGCCEDAAKDRDVNATYGFCL